MPISIALTLCILGEPLMAATRSADLEAKSEIAWGLLAMMLLGGLSLFLFGMEQMSKGLKSAMGEKMRDILSRVTSNRFKAATVGCVVTATIQSSSITTVLVVGFVSAGVMTLGQSVGVIMGANVGTTITAQIVAFKIASAAYGMVALGFALLFASKRDHIRETGNILMGLGLVFWGMGVMSEAMRPLRSYEPFIEFMSSMEYPFWGIIVGAAFTALVQSSSATTGIVIALASQGLMGLSAGIALIFGANIGTCVTAMLATLGKNRETLRVALVHVFFNVIGVLVWVFFIPSLQELVVWLSPKAEQLEGAARLAKETPRQIANAHAIFNISNTLLLLPFTTALAKLALRIVPEKPILELVIPRFLDTHALKVPSMALNCARLETARLARMASDALAEVPGALVCRDESLLRRITESDDIADSLQGKILIYMGELRKLNLSKKESSEFHKLMIIIDALERIGDVVSDDIIEICRKRLGTGIESSDTMMRLIAELHETLLVAMGDAIVMISDRDKGAAKRVLRLKSTVHHQVKDSFRHQEERFKDSNGNRLEIFRIEMDLVEKQRRIYSLIKRIAHQC